MNEETLGAKWASFEADVLMRMPSASTGARKLMKMVFYAGASAFYELAVRGLNAAETPDEANLVLVLLREEMLQFTEALGKK
jgi:hypothetical protein